jgi:hypothetical protein
MSLTVQINGNYSYFVYFKAAISVATWHLSHLVNALDQLSILIKPWESWNSSYVQYVPSSLPPA